MSGSDSKKRDISRRSLFRGTGILGAGLGLAEVAAAKSARMPARRHASMADVKFSPMESVRVGFIGVGSRGSVLLKQMLAVDGARITAICDLAVAKAEQAAQRVVDAGQAKPALYSGGENDFMNLIRRADVDLVVIATPWLWHVPMAIEAMKNGKHVGVEVPAATTLADCWRLVETSEETRQHCMMLENCCYGDEELMVLGMARAGLFGELNHGEAAYIHDLRGSLFEDARAGLWRRIEHTKHNGNLYPTHGLGPVAAYMDINRRDRFDYLVSVSSPQRGLDAFRASTVPKDSPKWSEHYVVGDMNTSIIKTKRGRTIVLQHDVVSPRPYERRNLISGTKGAFVGYPARIFLDEKQGKVKEDSWADPMAMGEQHRHSLWKKVGEIAHNLGGHGGMDFIMCYRLIQCMRQGLAPDIDVYDAAAWSAPTPLSQQSVGNGSTPAFFPDFTRGNWEQRPQSFVG